MDHEEPSGGMGLGEGAELYRELRDVWSGGGPSWGLGQAAALKTDLADFNLLTWES